MTNQYAERDAYELDEAGEYYATHISAMTREALHNKSDIAAELAYRDMVIAQLKAQVKQLKIMLKQQASVVIRNSYPWPDKDCPYSRAKDALDYCEKTPAQCLAERDYNTAKKAFINGVNYAKKRPDVILHKVIEMVAGDYAYGEQLRQAAKESK